MFSTLRLGTARRFASSYAPIHARKRRGVAIASGIALAGSAAAYASQTNQEIHADSSDQLVARPPPLSSLFRSYIVYSMCSVPMLIDWSPSILSALSSVPGIKQVTEVVVRHTFFDQFAGGDSARGCIPLMQRLRAENKGCLLVYSAEVDESNSGGSSAVKSGQTPVHKRIVEQLIESIDIAADFDDRFSSSTGRKSWIAVKMTALLPDAQSLINLSKHILHSRPRLPTSVPYPGSPASTDLAVLDSSTIPSELSAEDIKALKELHEDLIRISVRAQERGVRITVDAEYSWYQPAIDAYTLSLTRRFNKLGAGHNVQPLIYGTHQAYLQRAPSHLNQSLLDAQQGGYALGVKLVRGAYHDSETKAHSSSKQDSPCLSKELNPPVFMTKAGTDECYDACARVLVHRVKKDMDSSPDVARTGALFGTHNTASCQAILDELTNVHLAVKDADGVTSLGDDVLERVTFSQLLGMKDELTEYLVSNTRARNPVVMKYVPYGALSEVMPYLSRRAIENKSVLGNGGAAEERRRVGKEIRRRLFDF